MGPFVSIIQLIIFEKFIWCPSKYHDEMKILLPVTSAKIWPESGMLTVNITKLAMLKNNHDVQTIFTPLWKIAPNKFLSHNSMAFFQNSYK